MNLSERGNTGYVGVALWRKSCLSVSSCQNHKQWVRREGDPCMGGGKLRFAKVWGVVANSQQEHEDSDSGLWGRLWCLSFISPSCHCWTAWWALHMFGAHLETAACQQPWCELGAMKDIWLGSCQQTRRNLTREQELQLPACIMAKLRCPGDPWNAFGIF